jgi:hypothetical protein
MVAFLLLLPLCRQVVAMEVTALLLFLVALLLYLLLLL